MPFAVGADGVRCAEKRVHRQFVGHAGGHSALDKRWFGRSERLRGKLDGLHLAIARALRRKVLQPIHNRVPNLPPLLSQIDGNKLGTIE